MLRIGHMDVTNDTELLGTPYYFELRWKESNISFAGYDAGRDSSMNKCTIFQDTCVLKNI